MHALAIVEREMRRFRRSPLLIVMSMIFPLAQLVVLGYAFGGNVKHLKLAIVDQDHGVPAVRIRELAGAVVVRRAHARPDRLRGPGPALSDLRNGRVNGVLTIPPDFSRRVAVEEPAARRADLRQHRQLRLGHAGRRRSAASSARSTRRPRRARLGRADARHRRGLSLRPRTSSICCRVRSRCRFS